MKEVWKDVQGYEGLYEISNYGRVKSWHKTKHCTPNGYLLKPSVNVPGYIYYGLKKDGHRKNFLCHRLVGMHFIDNPNDYPQINHMDENPKNNRVDNLEWCTPHYNTNYGTGIERRKQNTDYAFIMKKIDWVERAKKYYKKIEQLTTNGQLIKKWDAIIFAGESLNIPCSNITMCCKGRIKTAGGYVWRYAPMGGK